MAAARQRSLDASGTIGEYVGDHILACCEDADAAVNVALAALDAMMALNVDPMHVAEHPLAASVGIAIGQSCSATIELLANWNAR